VVQSGVDNAADDRLDRSTAEAAVAVAVRAPSIHNTQPWRWQLGPGGLTLLADRSRQLAVADPDGHSLLISCGAALHLTQVGLQAEGWQIETTLLPDSADPDVLARFRPVGRHEREDEAYVEEMSRWLRDPDVHVLSDGVPLEAIPHVAAGSPRHTDVPLRDFEVGVTGRQLIERDVDERPVIAVVLTQSDTAVDHLRSGQAMMRLMIEAELRGLASCPLSQAVDFAAFRTRVQGVMGWIGFPQMMLRIGYPSAPTSELARTPRRLPSAVLRMTA
jgi:nitroreductase